MTYQHQELAAGRWNELALMEQLGHVGSEVERALKWRGKNNPGFSMNAVDRALELLDLTIAAPGNRLRLKELCRSREVVVDFFCGENQYPSSEESLRAYFFHFACAARLAR